MDSLFEIDIDLAAKGSREASRTLYRQLKEAILDGRLGAGAKLPATRRSATLFRVSRNTAIEVYERLASEGYLATRRGAGTYVVDRVPVPAPPAAGGDAPPDQRLNHFWLRPEVTAALNFWRDAPEHRDSPQGAPAVDFRPALVDSRLFPFDVFRRVSAKQLRGLERKPARFKSPQGNQGNFSLREAIIKHIALTRAVVCRPHDILITSGAQQAFGLVARVLVTPNETVVAVEDPGYPPMRAAFAAAGARLVPVGIDEEGMIVEELPDDVSVISVCPSHQFPLGVTMSMRRRRALVEFARSRGAVILEDDYDGEFRYDGSPLEALRCADNADVVFYVGTFSKCMLSALRLGFLIAPDWAMRSLVTAKNCEDWHCPTPLQIGVGGFIAEGHLAQHVRKMREIYKKRRQTLLNFLQRELPDWLEPIPSLYGMHVAAVSRTSGDLDSLAQRLLEHNVKIHAFTRYYLGPPKKSGLIFGYAAADVPELNRGLIALRKALQG